MQCTWHHVVFFMQCLRDAASNTVSYESHTILMRTGGVGFVPDAIAGGFVVSFSKFLKRWNLAGILRICHDKNSPQNDIVLFSGSADHTVKVGR